MSMNFYLRKNKSEIHIGKRSVTGKFIANIPKNVVKTLVNNKWKIFNAYGHQFTYQEFLEEVNEIWFCNNLIQKNILLYQEEWS